MDNGTKLSKEQIETIKKELQSGNSSSNAPEEFMQKYLNKEQSDSVKKVLADPDKLKEILSSPFAKAFMKQYNNQKEE